MTENDTRGFSGGLPAETSSPSVSLVIPCVCRVINVPHTAAFRTLLSGGQNNSELWGGGGVVAPRISVSPCSDLHRAPIFSLSIACHTPRLSPTSSLLPTHENGDPQVVWFPMGPSHPRRSTCDFHPDDVVVRLHPLRRNGLEARAIYRRGCIYHPRKNILTA